MSNGLNKRTPDPMAYSYQFRKRVGKDYLKNKVARKSRQKNAK